MAALEEAGDDGAYLDASYVDDVTIPDGLEVRGERACNGLGSVGGWMGGGSTAATTFRRLERLLDACHGVCRQMHRHSIHRTRQSPRP